MLSTQNGHKKVIVLLTDGVPTYSYHVSKVHTQADGSYYGTAFSYSRPADEYIVSLQWLFFV